MTLWYCFVSSACLRTITKITNHRHFWPSHDCRHLQPCRSSPLPSYRVSTSKGEKWSKDNCCAGYHPFHPSRICSSRRADLLVDDERPAHYQLLGNHAHMRRVPPTPWCGTSTCGLMSRHTPSSMSPLLATFFDSGVRSYDPQEMPLALHETVPKLHEFMLVKRRHAPEVDFLETWLIGFESHVQEGEQS